jgi:hypothetical protein
MYVKKACALSIRSRPETIVGYLRILAFTLTLLLFFMETMAVVLVGTQTELQVCLDSTSTSDVCQIKPNTTIFLTAPLSVNHDVNIMGLENSVIDMSGTSMWFEDVQERHSPRGYLHFLSLALTRL